MAGRLPRVAGGLKPGQQEAILSRIGRSSGQKKADKQELAELWRLVASLD
ncbi:MAG: hypothetical protein KIT58_03475 [Planctomycetota bacterium]|nr:hypothetical protein [Planctomycetota bacterium]